MLFTGISSHVRTRSDQVVKCRYQAGLAHHGTQQQQIHHFTQHAPFYFSTFCLTSQGDTSHTESTPATSYAQRKAGRTGCGRRGYLGGSARWPMRTHHAVAFACKIITSILLPEEKSTPPSPAPLGVWIGEGCSAPFIAMNASKFSPDTAFVQRFALSYFSTNCLLLHPGDRSHRP